MAKTITIDISVFDGMEKSARKLKKGLDMADNASKQVKRALKELNREQIVKERIEGGANEKAALIFR